jgi:hypothetical protein
MRNDLCLRAVEGNSTSSWDATGFSLFRCTAMSSGSCPTNGRNAWPRMLCARKWRMKRSGLMRKRLMANRAATVAAAISAIAQCSIVGRMTRTSDEGKRREKEVGLRNGKPAKKEPVTGRPRFFVSRKFRFLQVKTRKKSGFTNVIESKKRPSSVGCHGSRGT